MKGALKGQHTINTWLQGLTEQWGEAPPDFDQRVALLRQFCEFVEQDPDTLIASCSREVDGGKRIRIKARRFYTEKITEFQDSLAADARDTGRAGNVIRSFFIHNGIFMQAGLHE